MRYLIAYDIPSNRWRNRLVKILEAFGERIQYSVFECELTEAGVAELRAKLKVGEFLSGRHGAVCVYPLDDLSVRNIERYGQSANIDRKSVIVT
jgi:CRISPR-associated protein Cas2